MGKVGSEAVSLAAMNHLQREKNLQEQLVLG